MQKKSHSEDWMAIIQKVLSYGAGEGLMEWCADEVIQCDEYEDTSLSDQVTGLFASNKKTSVCAINSLGKNISRVLLTAIIPMPFGYIVGNLTGNAIQCIQAYAQAGSARKKADNYVVCYDDRTEGHPLPLTDKQIAKILPYMNLFPTVDNIIEQYPKLCVKKKNDDNSYRFYNDGDVFDGVYVHHANGYPYVMCASIFEACPCIFNIQRGKINDPKYEKDENDVIKIRSDGTLIHKGDTETTRDNEKEYQAHYAKHCRLIRFKEVYEQSNDLGSIYSDACFDLHGYSKRQANITAGIVQCIEDTARNIFEKPILSVQQNQGKYDAYGVYRNDYDFVYGKYVKIKNLLQERTYENYNEYPAFLESDIDQILKLLQEIWFTNMSTSVGEYECMANGKDVFTGYQTNLYDKYIDSASKHATANCCATDVNISGTCYNNLYTSGSINDIKPSITKQQEKIALASMFVEIEKIEVLLNHIKNLKIKESNAESVKMNNASFTLTLFDLLRNKIKVIAVMALVIWIFLFGWKMINGDFGKIKTQEFGMIALRVFLCYMVVFSDSAKNLMFNLAIQTSQGVGMFFNDTLSEFRTQKDNKYSQACNMKQNAKTSPKKNLGEKVDATKTVEKKYTCQSWEEKVCTETSSGLSCICEEYKMSCEGDYPTLNCDTYFKNYENVENKNYCKKGTCSSSKGYILANIYKTGVQRNADEYNSYHFSCPDDAYDLGCSKYDQYYGNKECTQKQCQKFTLSCEENQTLACRRYKILNDGTRGACVSGVCVQDKSVFVLMPPMERPYKIKTYYNVVNPEDGAKKYQPYCHKIPEKNTDKITYQWPGDPAATEKYSAMLNTKIFVCPDGYELDDGFRINEYIAHGIIPDDDGVLAFQSLLSEEEQSLANSEKIAKLKKMPVPTAVATSDQYGNISEYNFIDQNRSAEGFQRAKYRTYIRSLLSYVNKNADYPKIKEYGFTRNYSHLSFWDTMDCKIIQFISMQGFDGGFTDNVNDVISGVKNGDLNQTANSSINGMFQFLKFMFMAFPFGILVFILMFGIGAALFMLVARAAQQYCICVFHLVLLIYLSPFVFMLWLFDQTKKVMDTWVDDMKNNILGACVPFVSISMFLFIIDWLMFGDTSKYVSMQLFLPSGEINDNCYEGNLNDAPIACLTKRCLNTFTWLGLLNLNQGPSLYSAEAMKTIGFLVLRCLFAAGIIMAMTSMLDKMEEAIYKVIGEKPSMELDVGFNQKASDSIKAGKDAGLGAGKFAMSAMAGASALAFQAAKIPILAVAGAVNFLGNLINKEKWNAFKGRIGNGISNFTDGIRNAVTYVPRKIGEGITKLKNKLKNAVSNGFNSASTAISRSFAKTFNTQSFQQHQQRLNRIQNNYNQAVARQNEIRTEKINKIQEISRQQIQNNINKVEDYGKNLASQKNNDGSAKFNADQINAMKEQKLSELRSEVQRLEQEGRRNIDQEFTNKQAELYNKFTEGINEENKTWGKK